MTIERTYAFRVSVASEHDESEPDVVKRAVQAWKDDLFGDIPARWDDHIHSVKEVLS